jgi:hypothetical protein
MNFMAILNSLDELLYEVMSWLVFYPITLWRSVRHPLRMMAYADTELADAVEQRFTDVLSPPIFLLITLLISHALELSVTGDSPLVADNKGLASLVNNDTNLIILRMLAFALFPLFNSLRLVRARREKLDRDTLKLPFYSQCYVTSAMALIFGIGTTMSQCHPLAVALVGVALMVVGIVWYLGVQLSWFRQQLATSWLKALGHAVRAYLGAVTVFLIAAWMVVGQS